MKVFAVTVRVKKAKVAAAKEFFKSFVQPSRAEAGCLQYDLFQSATNDQVFYFFEKWQSDELLEKHSLQPFLREFKARYEELLEEPNERLWLNPIEPQ